MQINTEQIAANSDMMFNILNTAQKEIIDKNEKIAKINIENKVKADKKAILGKVINMYV